MDPGQDTQNYPPDEGSYDSLFMDLDAVYQAVCYPNYVPT